MQGVPAKCILEYRTRASWFDSWSSSMFSVFLAAGSGASVTSDEIGPFPHQSLNPLHLSSGQGGGMLVSFAAVEQALKDMGDPLGEAQVRFKSSSCLPSPGSISAQLVCLPLCL